MPSCQLTRSVTCGLCAACASIAFLVMLPPVVLVARPYAARPVVRRPRRRHAGRPRTPRGDRRQRAPSEREIEIPPARGALRARVYEPSAGRAARAAGRRVSPRRHRRAAAGALARQLAAQRRHGRHAGHSRAVALRDRAGDHDAIERRRSGWPTATRRSRRDGKVGLMGIGFSGGLVGRRRRPAVAAGPVAYVLSVGGHDDLPRVLRYLCTGTEPRPANQLQLAATRPAGSAAFVLPPARIRSRRAAARHRRSRGAGRRRSSRCAMRSAQFCETIGAGRTARQGAAAASAARASVEANGCPNRRRRCCAM